MGPAQVGVKLIMGAKPGAHWGTDAFPEASKGQLAAIALDEELLLGVERLEGMQAPCASANKPAFPQEDMAFSRFIKMALEFCV